jgi:hypothetical protein
MELRKAKRQGFSFMGNTKSSFLRVLMAALLGVAGTWVWTQEACAQGQERISRPDLSGFWQLEFDSENVPPAVLTPDAAERESNKQYQHDLYAIRWCNHVGMPALMQTPAPIDIRQGSIEIAIASEAVAAARHIYTDGRNHPDMAIYDNQSNGHSVGHWEGDVLVVDTVGFSDKGVTRIPGGGFRTENSHLTERYRLLSGGKQLAVTFTWQDSKVFAKPHTYEYRYNRAPAGTYAREYFCDASNAERAKFLSGPPAPATVP